MESNIFVSLPNTWLDISKQNPEGPSTYIRQEYKKSLLNYLQFSLANYVKGKIPNPTESDLIALSEKAGVKANFGKLVKNNSGNCKFGKFGTAIFSSEENPLSQVWYLSNGKDFILVSYLCSKEPHELELQEVENIVMNAFI